MTTDFHGSERAMWPSYSHLIDRLPLWMNDSILPRCGERHYCLMEEWGFMWKIKSAGRGKWQWAPIWALSRGASPREASTPHLHPSGSPFNKYQSLCDLFKAQRWAGRVKRLGICNYLLPIFSHSHHCSGSPGLTLETVDLKHPSTLIKTPWYWHRNG